MTTEDKAVLLTTGNAAGVLGVSNKTLRRYRDIEGGFLIQDKEWFYGAFDNSPIRWDINKCKEALSKRRKGFSKYQGLSISQKNLGGSKKKMIQKERHLHIVQMLKKLNPIPIAGCKDLEIQLKVQN